MAVTKPQKLDIVIAVTSEDRTYNNYTSDPIPTSFLLSAILFPVISYHSLQKKK